MKFEVSLELYRGREFEDENTNQETTKIQYKVETLDTFTYRYYISKKNKKITKEISVIIIIILAIWWNKQLIRS